MRLAFVSFIFTASAMAQNLRKIEYVDCAQIKVSPEEIAGLKAQVERAFAKYESVFPALKNVAVKAGFDCDGSRSTHAAATTASPDVIEVYGHHPSRREEDRKRLRDKIQELFPAGSVPDYEARMKEYLAWKLGDRYLEEVVFHELVHALNDRSNLPELFRGRIRPAFAASEKKYSAANMKHRSEVFPRLQEKLVEAGLKDWAAKTRVNPGEGSWFRLADCAANAKRAEGPDARLKQACDIISGFNRSLDIGTRREEVRRREAHDDNATEDRLNLPRRHAFDGHVYETFNPRKRVYDEEFLTISAEAAFYPPPYDFYAHDRSDPNVRGLKEFWRQTDFKQKLEVYDEPKGYYLDPTQLERRVWGVRARAPERVELIRDLNAKLGVKKTSKGNVLQLLHIKAKKPGGRKILIDAGHHADEVLAQKALFNWLEKVLDDPKYDDLELFVVPTVNVDGAQRVFKDLANQRCNDRTERLEGETDSNDGSWHTGAGIDLNRNYPSEHWNDIAGGCPKGPAPLSEVETQVMDKLADWVKPDRYVSLHNAGNEVVCPKGSAKLADPASKWCWEMARQMRSTVGYAPREADSYGESIEYFAATKKIPSLILELGPPLQMKKEGDNGHAPRPVVAEKTLKDFESLMGQILRK